MKVRGLVVTVLAGCLGGCATLSKEQCISADWYQLGYQDALDGRPIDLVDRHARACAKAGVVPDEVTWLEGYRAALPYFCVADTGYRFGIRDANYHGQCPPHLEQRFLDGYRLGQDIHDLNARIAEADEAIDELREAMNSDDATEVSLEVDGRWLEHYKTERERLRRQLFDLEMRARQRGFPAAY
jgi:hypothetical protein